MVVQFFTSMLISRMKTKASRTRPVTLSEPRINLLKGARLDNSTILLHTRFLIMRMQCFPPALNPIPCLTVYSPHEAPSQTPSAPKLPDPIHCKSHIHSSKPQNSLVTSVHPLPSQQYNSRVRNLASCSSCHLLPSPLPYIHNQYNIPKFHI